ncbi:MAG TPA: alanine racemase [Candidatus Paceibacterota bacterium]
MMIPIFPELDKNKKTIEGVKIKKLIEQYGSPLFVMSGRIIREKHRIFSEALAKYYSNSQIAYSVKTNYLPGVVNTLKALGCWAEAVSGFEYWLAKKLNFPGNQIIFNGPDKKTEEIETAVKEGALLNVDNQAELQRLIEIAEKAVGSVKIGLRVNAKVGQYPWSRFGFNLENGEAYEAVKMINKNHPNIGLSGLHTHIGTNLNEPKYYFEIAEKISDFALNLKKGFGIDLEYLDLGGGFAVPGSRWLNNPVWVVPEIEEYIKSIAEAIEKRWLGKKPKLFFEPGRYLVDEAGIFMTTVGNQKKIEPGHLVNVDSSIYTQLQAVGYRKNIIDVIQENTSEYVDETPTWIGGNSCIGTDFLAQSAPLPELRAGDILVFYNAGAYTMVRSEQWINTRPAVVMIKENGSVECIRRKEDYENMIALDEF